MSYSMEWLRVCLGLDFGIWALAFGMGTWRRWSGLALFLIAYTLCCFSSLLSRTYEPPKQYIMNYISGVE